jgi:hypothetical protein
LRQGPHGLQQTALADARLAVHDDELAVATIRSHQRLGHYAELLCALDQLRV